MQKTQADKPEEKKPAQESVSISRDQFDALLKTVNDLKEQNKMLVEVADRGRLDAYQQKTKGAMPTFVRISTFDFKGERKIVTGWKTTKDEVFKASNGAWVENQLVEMLFEDGSRARDVSLADFYRNTAEKLKAEVIGRDDNAGTYTVKFEDGKELTIGVTFVN